MNYDLIPHIKIMPNRLVWFDRPEGNIHRGHLWRARPKLELYKKYEVSKHSSGIMKDKIEMMLMMAKPQWVWSREEKKWFKFTLNFITLTLSSPQKHSDIWIKEKMLNTFLTRLRLEYKVHQYIWRAEAQANGRIHFHILINKYIHHSVIRSMWNKIQERQGYIKDYQEKYGNNNPNSTDIHSIKKVRNISAYLSKYMTKEQKVTQATKDVYNTEIYDNSIYSVASHRRVIEGRIWGCSYFLSSLKGLVMECFDWIDTESRAIWKKGRFVNPNPYVSIIYMKVSEWKHLAPLLWRRFKQYLWDTYNYAECAANFNNIN